MELFGIDIVYILGTLVIIGAILLVVSTIIGAMLLYLFWKTRKIILPKLTLLLIGFLESPIKITLTIFGLDSETVDRVRAQIINKVYESQFKKVSFAEQVFLVEQVEIVCKYFGYCAGFKYAEPFVSNELICVKKLESLADF